MWRDKALAGVLVVGEPHHWSACRLGGQHHMLSGVVRIELGVDHDQVGLQLGNVLGQKSGVACLEDLNVKKRYIDVSGSQNQQPHHPVD